MHIKQTRGERAFEVVNLFILTLVVVVTLYPFLHVVFASFSNPNLLAAHSGVLLHPLGFSLEAYKAVLSQSDIYTGYRNTLFLVIVGTCISLSITVLSAYVLSRRGFRLRPLLNLMAVFTMFFSGGLIPFYLQIRTLGLRESLWGLILPTAMSTYNLIVLRTAFYSVPVSLEEAARMDGANRWKQILHVTIPGIMPTFILLLIMQIGQLLNCVFDKIYLLQNTLNLQVSEMLPTYVSKTGMISQKYGLATAGGLFNSVISVVLVLIANTISRKVSETSLF